MVICIVEWPAYLATAARGVPPITLRLQAEWRLQCHRMQNVADFEISFKQQTLHNMWLRPRKVSQTTSRQQGTPMETTALAVALPRSG